jgi:hypothetical protein
LRLRSSSICMLRPTGWLVCTLCLPAVRATISGATTSGTCATLRISAKRKSSYSNGPDRRRSTTGILGTESMGRNYRGPRQSDNLFSAWPGGTRGSSARNRAATRGLVEGAAEPRAGRRSRAETHESSGCAYVTGISRNPSPNHARSGRNWQLPYLARRIWRSCLSLIWRARAFRRRLTVAQKFYETRGAAGPA